MIRTALEFVKKELDVYIANREQNSADYGLGSIVDLISVVLPNGDVNIRENSHITVMLVGIDEERREGKRPHFVTMDDSRKMQLSPPVDLNLHLLFVASNVNYETALRDISSVVSFFQSNPVFDEQKFPGLNASVVNPSNKPWQLIERLSFRIQSLTFEQLNNLWAMLGGKYMPSIVYHVNLLTIFESRSDIVAPPITEMNYNEQ